MKKICLLMLFSCCFSMVSISMNNRNSDTAKELHLSGKLLVEGQRSLTEPVQAFITGQQFIQVDFNAMLGNIEIFVCDETGNIVYRHSVITYAGQQILIDTASLRPGEYTIRFTNSQNRYLEGCFEI